jgi:pre-mRNA-splicing factor ATP-dependent RNA helicase DHX38/PRP16
VLGSRLQVCFLVLKVLLRLPFHWHNLRLGDGGVTSQTQKPGPDAPRGLGDFQNRSNRAERERRRRGYDNAPDFRARDGDRDNDRRGWADSTPRATPRRDDAPSVRVPNVAWDSTPRSHAGSGSDRGWGAARDRRWDAPTPRSVRGRDDDEDDGISIAGGREWEEEQVKLDRDWYMGNEGGVVSLRPSPPNNCAYSLGLYFCEIDW